MKRIVRIPFGRFYEQKFFKPIREEKDVLLLVLDTLSFLSYGSLGEETDGYLLIKTGKMNRVFYRLPDKYFSIAFPFDIVENEEMKGSYSIYDTANGLKIDNKMISLMKGMADNLNLTKCTLEELFDSIWNDSIDEDITEEEVENGFRIIAKILISELGYIRYDYDSKYENGDMHPLNHLDVNYKGNCTYKLGLKKRIDIDEFVDILDVGTKCSYLMGT